MQAASRRTDSEEPVSPPTSRLLTHIEGLEASIEGLDEWWEAGLEIATEVNSPELRKKFLGMVKGAREAKRQCIALQNEKRKVEVELQQQHTKFAGEIKVMEEEIDKLKKDFDAVKDQNDRLIGQLHGHGAVQSRVQKRQWSQASYLETSSSSSPPHKQARVSLSGCSLDQIRDVLGGPDRGWGLVQGKLGAYRTLLDIKWHLFGQSPTCKQDVGKAIFGFGQADNEVISKGIVFQLFVRDPNRTTRKFTYLGNYTATKLDPVAWDKLSKEEKDLVIEVVQSKGLSADGNVCKAEMEMDPRSIYQQFLHGTFKVPCSRLEFQDFDDHLNVSVQNSPIKRK